MRDGLDLALQGLLLDLAQRDRESKNNVTGILFATMVVCFHINNAERVGKVDRGMENIQGVLGEVGVGVLGDEVLHNPLNLVIAPDLFLKLASALITCSSPSCTASSLRPSQNQLGLSLSRA